jgi:radical SAM protein with 4Fe4S-binding SPASM domain
MKELNFDDFSENFDRKISRSIPLNGQIELTYRCSYQCLHCYCKAYNRIENQKKELSFTQWQRILDQIYAEGGLYLTLTGGDPLLHKDFFKIYDYAVKKGFLVSVFTSGYLLQEKHLRHFLEKRPFNIEITLNGITARTYETITGVAGSFKRVKDAIEKIKAKRLPLVLKTNALRENKNEVLRIKRFVERFLGKGKYKFDIFICAGLGRSLEPTQHRLEANEIEKIIAADPDMRKLCLEQLKKHRYNMRAPEYLYQCNSWMQGYYVNPYGLLQFCHLSTRFSTDLLKKPFKQGFYEEFPKLLLEKYKTRSRCINCKKKEYCYHCPARAYVETGDEEAPVAYFCDLAKVRPRESRELIGAQR